MGNFDVHYCGDCKSQFRTLQDFFVHKLDIEKYTLTLEDSGLLPGLRIPVFSKVNIGVNKNFEESFETDPPLEEVEVYDADELSEEEMVVDSPTEALKIDEHLPSPQVNTNENNNQEANESNLEDKDTNEDDHEHCKEDNENCLTVKCSICGRKYKNKSVLKVHKRTVHSVDRPHSCSYCSMTFKTKGSMIRHKRRHTDERPYKCTSCEKCFRDSGSLTRHMKSILPCYSFNKTLSKELKDSVKAKRSRPTSVNVLITRVGVVVADR